MTTLIVIVFLIIFVSVFSDDQDIKEAFLNWGIQTGQKETD